ncbi:MAG: hypothetical protein ACD_22C00171G0013 [uncultured bacterium]|nr:MAG: hypothetical protein ACD_22C00171G0013 [uncultured bacterium]
MIKKLLVIGILILSVIVTSFLILKYTTYQKQKAENASTQLVLYSPKPNEIITSPLTIKGKAVGTWYFEGDFPISILDSDNNIVFQTYVSAKGDWMVTDFVEFERTFEFTTPASDTGTLVLTKDNPSDMRELDDEVRIPIRFR